MVRHVERVGFGSFAGKFQVAKDVVEGGEENVFVGFGLLVSACHVTAMLQSWGLW